MTLHWADASATGTLGSWTLDDRGSDSPWLPAVALEEIRVGSGRLTVRFEGPVPIGAWAARAAAASDASGESAATLGGRDDVEPAVTSVVLEPLPPGQWVIAVRLDRADGRGDATCYWLVRGG